MNTFFNYMDYQKTKTIANSMFEQDVVNLNLTYNDLSCSKCCCHNTYDDLKVNDIELHIDDNVKCILNKLN